MPNIKRIAVRTSLVLCGVLAACSPALAHADSVVWNTTLSGSGAICLSGVDVCWDPGFHYALGFNDPNQEPCGKPQGMAGAWPLGE